MITGRGDTDDLFHCLMDRYHYLGCHGHVGEHIKYMAFNRDRRPLACLLFGSAAWKTAPRDRFIGWDGPTREANLSRMTNNTRFLILPWIQVKNLASRILAACVRRLRRGLVSALRTRSMVGGNLCRPIALRGYMLSGRQLDTDWSDTRSKPSGPL